MESSILTVCSAPLRRRIHAAFHVQHAGIIVITSRVTASSLIMYRSCRIQTMAELSALFHIRTIATLITQRPHDRCSLITVSQYISFLSIQIGLNPIRILREISCIIVDTGHPEISYTMGFQIRFAYHVKS